MSDIVMIPLGRLRPDPHQARRTFQRIPELADSIARYGLLKNLVVRQADSNGIHQIKAGERRYRALYLLKQQDRLTIEDVPCFVVRTDGEYEAPSCSRMWSVRRTFNTLVRTSA